MRFAGFYTDGQTARRQEVSVLLGAEGLRILSDSGALIAQWPFREVRFLEEVFSGNPSRLYHRGNREAVLTVPDAGFVPALRERSGARMGLFGHIRPSMRVGLITVLLIGVVITGLVFAAPRLVAPITSLIPPEWEDPLGNQVVERIGGEASFCSNPEGVAVLEKLAARLTKNRKLPSPLRVRVKDSDIINAFAAPGGQVVFMRGLIELVETPEELTFVLAHEIAHSARRHPMQALVRFAGIQLIFSTLTGNASGLESTIAEFSKFLLFFSYTRDAEREADRVGIEMLNQANIRGDGLVTFFERLMKMDTVTKNLPKMLSTHPIHEERIKAAKPLTTGKEKAMTKKEWKALRNICGKTA